MSINLSFLLFSTFFVAISSTTTTPVCNPTVSKSENPTEFNLTVNINCAVDLIEDNIIADYKYPKLTLLFKPLGKYHYQVEYNVPSLFEREMKINIISGGIVNFKWNKNPTKSNELHQLVSNEFVRDEQNNLIEHESAKAKANRRYRKWILTDITDANHNVKYLVLKPPAELIHFKVPIGHHIYFKKGDLERPYTPVTENSLNEDNNMKLLIKIYDKGQLTSQIKDFQIGDSIDVSDHEGDFILDSKFTNSQRLVLITGGVGLTPMINLVRLSHQMNKEIVYLNFNRQIRDVIWDNNNFWSLVNNVHKIFTKEKKDYTGLKGRNSIDMMEKTVGSPRTNDYVLICGSSGFNIGNRRTVKGFGYTDDQIYVFSS